jgi:hypothetical protein
VLGPAVHDPMPGDVDGRQVALGEELEGQLDRGAAVGAADLARVLDQLVRHDVPDPRPRPRRADVLDGAGGEALLALAIQPIERELQ